MTVLLRIHNYEMFAKTMNQLDFPSRDSRSLLFSCFGRYFGQPRLHFSLLGLTPSSQLPSVFCPLPLPEALLKRLASEDWTVDLWETRLVVACSVLEGVTPSKEQRKGCLGGTPSGSLQTEEDLPFG